MAAPHPALIPRLVVAFVSTVLCFAVVEIGLRLVYGHPPPVLDRQVRHRAEPYGYKPLPNQKGVYTVDKPVTTNAFGFRDSEWTLKKRAGTVRILVMGDSFTFGNNNLVDDIYPTVVEKMLRERFGDPVEVLNTSAGGWDLDNEAAFLQHEGIQYEPDIVVIGFFLNDLLQPRVLQSELIPGGRVEGRPKSLRWVPYSVVRMLKRSAVISYLRGALSPVIDGPDFVSDAIANNVDVEREPRLAQGRRLLQAIVASCRRNGITLLIAAIPPVNLFWRPKGRVDVLEEIKQFAEKNGIVFVDLAEPFWAERDPVSHYGYPWDNHFNGSGHLLAARALYPALASAVEARLVKAGATE